MLAFYVSMLESEEEKQKMADIYAGNKHRLLQFALTILKNRTLAEDAVHNTFIELIQHKEKYFSMPCRDLASYTVSIVRSKCYDILRKEQKYVGFDESSETQSANEIEGIILKKLDVEWLISAIESLPEQSQDLLFKKYVLEYSHAKIAEECDMTLKNVEVTLYRIRQRIKKMAQKEDDVHG